MPVYEYQCAKCEHEFERQQRITEDPVKTCPQCKSRRVKKLISQTSFVLKGGGWYADGYGNAAGSKDSDSSTDGSSTTSEDKPTASDEKSSKDKKAIPSDSASPTSKAGDSKAKPSKKNKKSGKAAA